MGVRSSISSISGVSIVSIEENSISLRLSISRPLAKISGTKGVRVGAIVVGRVSKGVGGSISSIAGVASVSIVSIEKSSISLRLGISRPLANVSGSIGVRVGTIVVGGVSKGVGGSISRISSVAIVSIEESSISLRLSISGPLAKISGSIGVRVGTIVVGRVS